jgi:hypothetical protein
LKDHERSWDKVRRTNFASPWSGWEGRPRGEGAPGKYSPHLKPNLDTGRTSHPTTMQYGVREEDPGRFSKPSDKDTRARQIKDYGRGLVARYGVSIPPLAARPVKYRERRKPGPRRSMMKNQKKYQSGSGPTVL